MTMSFSGYKNAGLPVYLRVHQNQPPTEHIVQLFDPKRTFPDPNKLYQQVVHFKSLGEVR